MELYVVTTKPNHKKKFTEGNARKLAFFGHVYVTKITKTRVGHAYLFI